MLKATHPRAGRARVAMMPMRLSPAASCATSDAACALPADTMVAAAVLHAATLMICSCTHQAKSHIKAILLAMITTLIYGITMHLPQIGLSGTALSRKYWQADL